ncbi:single-stranded-DNA-specific exonuclease RecJ [Desulfonatronovibrio magnus]|uniref:single-stranded-DNA-specific exonuclease RecJ n=1 Tax=Desulfonatronovibrio magnus TaxID=698827 RepID=UPI0005EB6344|nr:single-stranded-DNA-specific exonuclease RecJ [Desulfonatronovibrio magnus]RQD62541.1 MAG: single-stranded-DNA-specific exonuclease RecJ [Desulfonatronovibrio sp. MSAO_Bac4]
MHSHVSQNTLKWRVKNTEVSKQFIYDLSRRLEISPVLCLLLHQRGMTTYDDMHFFLSPGLRYLPPLHEWPCLEEAARILAASIENKEKIAVWGDYDVDGITSVALIKDFFNQRGYEITPILPHRMEDGYGLNMHEMESLAKEGVKTLITVDCGISNLKEVSKARELGIKVILTDHHQPGQELPPANAIINPKISGPCPHPELAGVGTAFFLMAALNRILPGDQLDIRNFLDLVALGTIADLVHLDRTNRILVKNGLLLLDKHERPGIKALKEVSGINGNSNIGAGEVGFALGPRINAAGRLDDPAIALELLLTSDHDLALKLAHRLNKLNEQRKKTEQIILEQAREMALKMMDYNSFVLYHPEWHPGVVGIVASRIVDEFHKPCFVLTQDGDYLKGSGRSIEKCNLYESLCAVSHVLEKYGGHSQAAGLSIAPDNLEEFRQLFDEQVVKALGPGPVSREIMLDAALNLDEINPELISELELLQPLGPGNPRPVFLSPELTVLDQTLFGNDKHIRFHLKDENSEVALRAQFWRKGDTWGQKSIKGKKVVVAYTPAINHYRGVTSIRLNIREILSVK